MASTYSPILKLELIGNGDQSGTWGTTTNTNLGTLIEQAIAGTSSIDVTSSDVTLTNLNGVSDQARCAALLITGTPGVTRNVIAPAVSKIFVISNTTASAIVIKTASSTGYTIPANTNAIVYYNGTDFILASGLANTLTASAALVTPSLSAETYSTSATVTAGTNAQGQGALTSDYNVITTAAANPSGVTLPTATVGRRIIIVNKGANAINVYPATGGYIDGLAINTSISIAVGGWMEFNASSTTQWYSSANAVISNVVTSFNTGTTGLTPFVATTGAVTLAGTLAVTNGGTGATTAPGANAKIQTYTTTATAAGTTVLTNTSTYYQYFTGTNTQTVTLPVTSTLSLGWSFHIVNNSTGNVTVNSSGGNLVNTILPGTTIHVTCVGTSLTTAADWDSGTTDFDTVTGTGSVVLNTSPTFSGYAAFGATNPYPTQWRLYSKADGTSPAITAHTFTATGSAISCLTEVTTASLASFYYGTTSSYTSVGYITTNGTSTSYGTSSDRRLKKDVTPMTNGLSKVMQLKPVDYTWISNNTPGQGFIADELQAVIPEAVTGEPNALNPDGTPRYQNIDTSFIVAFLVNAIQEQQVTIESLTARVTALESK